jgi:sulfur-oxidizing protein SoxZ
MPRLLINLPERATRGEIIEVKTLIQHPMETGYRLDRNGARIPRGIINRFACTYNGEEVFRAELYPAIAANPFIAFSTIATESGELVFTWTDDDGQSRPRAGKLPSNEEPVRGSGYARRDDRGGGGDQAGGKAFRL